MPLVKCSLKLWAGPALHSLLTGPFVRTLQSIGVAVGAVANSDMLEQFPTSADIPNYYIREQRILRGTVASVADGDTLRLRHTPLFSRSTFQGKLSENTIQVRLLAVDAPEIGKFGSSSQPFAEEAKELLRKKTLGKRIQVKCAAKDQYGRLVGQVQFGGMAGLGQVDASELLLRKGLAVVYRGKDGSYGARGRDGWEQLEADAKRKAQGMWKDGGQGVSPSEFKRQQRAAR